MDQLDKYLLYLGKTVDVTIDRPRFSKHPELGFEYPVNYGYLPGTLAGDGSEIDAYVLGVEEPMVTFSGRCIAVIERRDDDENKLVVANQAYSRSEIAAAVDFVEAHYDSHLILESDPVSSDTSEPCR